MTTPTPEVIEACAKALFESKGRRVYSWENHAEGVRETYRKEARIVIAEYLKQTGAGK